MIWCRFQRGETIGYGRIVDDEVIEVDGGPIGPDGPTSPADTGVTYALGEVRLLAPIIPPMLYAAGPNHRGHVEGMARRRGSEPNYPKIPEPNFRSVHAIIGAEENIVVPAESSGAVQPEGQLAVVIGKHARKVTGKAEAWTACLAIPSATTLVSGYGRGATVRCSGAKNCDTFKPLGPWIVTGLEPDQFGLLSGITRRCGRTLPRRSRFGMCRPGFMDMSKYTTLHPGDVLWMGTQGGRRRYGSRRHHRSGNKRYRYLEELYSSRRVGTAPRDRRGFRGI